MSNCLRAFHSDPAVQRTILDQIKGHYQRGEIQQRFFWIEGVGGCLVGCSTHDAQHILFESMWGVPEPIARLADLIFEYLPKVAAPDFATAFWYAIPLGADLSECAAWAGCIVQDAYHRIFHTGLPVEAVPLAVELLLRLNSAPEAAPLPVLREHQEIAYDAVSV